MYSIYKASLSLWLLWVQIPSAASKAVSGYGYAAMLTTIGYAKES